MHRHVLLPALHALALGVLLGTGCRAPVPTSGTPLAPDEDLDAGVARELNVYGLRQVDLVAAADKLARDVSGLLKTGEAREGTGDAGGPARVLVLGGRNRSKMPSGSYRVLTSQLVRNVAASGGRHGVRFVSPAEASAGEEPFDYTLFVSVYELGSISDRTLAVDYVVTRVPSSAEARSVEAARELVAEGRRSMPRR